MEPFGSHYDDGIADTPSTGHEPEPPMPHYPMQAPTSMMSAQSQPNRLENYGNSYPMPHQLSSQGIGPYPMARSASIINNLPQAFEGVLQQHSNVGQMRSPAVPTGFIRAPPTGPAAMRQPSHAQFEPAGYRQNPHSGYRTYHRPRHQQMPSGQQHYEQHARSMPVPMSPSQQYPRYQPHLPMPSQPFGYNSAGYYQNNSGHYMPSHFANHHTAIPYGNHARRNSQMRSMASAASAAPQHATSHLAATMSPVGAVYDFSLPMRQPAISWSQVVTNEVSQDAFGLANPSPHEPLHAGNPDDDLALNEEFEKERTYETATLPELGLGHVEQDNIASGFENDHETGGTQVDAQHKTIDPSLIHGTKHILNLGSRPIAPRADMKASGEDQSQLVTPGKVPPAQGKAEGFITLFNRHVGEDHSKLATLNSLCQKYGRRDISETDLYGEMYRLLHNSEALHLMPNFLELLPPPWKDANLAWLDESIKQQLNQASHANDQEQPGSTQTQADSKLEHKRKKKRPINGFRASDAREGARVLSTATLAPYAAPEDPNAAAVSGKEEHKLLSGSTGAPLIEMPAKYGKRDAANAKKVAVAARKHLADEASKKQTISEAASEPPKAKASQKPIAKANVAKIEPAPAPAPIKKPRYTYGQTDPSEIPHFGPVFPTRRAILGRDSRPYIHAHCGKRFVHPQEVVQHHMGKKGMCANHDLSRPWNEHPSCHVNYTDLNYAKCKNEQYILMDQHSLDILEAAIAAGLKEGDVDIDADADHEIESEEEGQGPVHTASKKRAASSAQKPAKKVKAGENDQDSTAMVRAAALGLRKRN